MDSSSSPTLLRPLRPQPSGGARTSVGRRRNGKLQSCEPCRKSKLRCDHSNKSASEERHLATPSSSATGTPTRDTPSSASAAQDVARGTRHERSVAAPPGCGHPVPAEVISPATTDADERSIHNEHNPGYVGVTSYSTIFSEGFADLTAAEPPVDEHKCKQQQAIAEKNMPQSREVLAFLQNRALIDDFVDHFHQLEEDGGLLGQPILDTWRRGLWAIHGDVLQRQDPAEIKRLAELLWDNSHKPGSVTRDMSTRAWAEADTGYGLRWVTVGLVVAMVGLCAQQMLETHMLFRKHAIERKTLLANTGGLMQACLGFYRQCKIIDLRLAWLVLAVSLMPDANKSDFSYASYRESGELNDIVITMGLHQPPRTEVPLFHAELRKRTFLCAYAREIATATFLGRPPRLSHWYCWVEPPLDLSDEELFLDPPELARVIANLDPKGFNPSHKFRRSSYLRAWIRTSIAREDLLDLALGKYTLEETVAAAARIGRDIEENWASYPDFISRIRTEKVSTLLAGDVKNALTPLQSLLQYSIRHGTKSTELLLQLVLIRKANSQPSNSGSGPQIKPDTMIRIASEFLTGCLELSQNKTLVYNFPQDISAFIGNQGMRAAAIVGVELLKQEQRLQRKRQQQQHGVVRPGDDEDDEPPLLPRSQTIQNLAVFASVLASVDPSDGMAAISAQGNKVIGRILDKLLTPEFNSGPAPMAACNHRSTSQEAVTGAEATNHPSGHFLEPTQSTRGSKTLQHQQQQAGPAGHGPAASAAAPTHVHPGVLTSSSSAMDVIADVASNLPSAALADGADAVMPDVDLWNFVYSANEEGPAPFLGYDHDFMAWLENMDFDGRI
ncbi:hypothetical protein Micbo1qcDRAFT_235332 [Microdochium bolleyi]|uniref:Xylanolytic transcriptional activator regulatory domain-containing protein n=1 Tax=Microdochium bolleyi TaxID=196109 RepID=A0A136IXC0_9PEZI|nr:hypothetical protein Micbo1qcDRAFT_235332 [Microdochium bolleyi]